MPGLEEGGFTSTDGRLTGRGVATVEGLEDPTTLRNACPILPIYLLCQPNPALFGSFPDHPVHTLNRRIVGAPPAFPMPHLATPGSGTNFTSMLTAILHAKALKGVPGGYWEYSN